MELPEMDYHISTTCWSSIYAFLKSQKGLHTKNENKLRIFIESCWYILRTGCQWRLLPKYYGNFRSIHKRFKRWAEHNIWSRLMNYVSDIDFQELMIDSTIVRAHACASGQILNGNKSHALGRSVGGFTTRIHAVVDALGNPITFRLTEGKEHDIPVAYQLLKYVKHTTVLADKAYYSDKMKKMLNDNHCEVVIPSKSNAIIPHQFDKHIYKERHLIECFFSKIKQFRRVFSRFDKTIEAYTGFLSFAGALIWLR